MNIEIRILTPDLAEEYVQYFDETTHDVGIDEHKCYCVTWRGDESYIGNGDHWFPTREERRSRAIQYVKNGSIQGYLAYNNGKIVGWCNANANCQVCLNYLKTIWPIDDSRTDIKGKSVFCFMIAPDMQRRGIATRLLEQVCVDAKQDGFDYVEAYVDTHEKKYFDTPFDFMGPLTMYENCGFIRFSEQDNKVVMRKILSEKMQ